MKVILSHTAITENCTHKRLACGDCGTFWHDERPGPKGLNMRALNKFAKAVREADEEAEKWRKENSLREE